MSATDINFIEGKRKDSGTGLHRVEQTITAARRKRIADTGSQNAREREKSVRKLPRLDEDVCETLLSVSSALPIMLN